MDGHRFDDLLRYLTDSRRSLLGGTLAGLAGVLGLPTVEAKKKHRKKKPCRKKCKNGCCTSKNGKCIKPAQQTSTRCGTGGEICRSDGCGGGGCGADCETCCANGECVDAGQISNEQCGVGGEDCFACPEGQICDAPEEGCCAPVNATCDNANDCCDNTLAGTLECEDNRCCVATMTTAGGGGLCSGDDDCCEPDDVCEGGACVRPEGASCQPGDLLCASNLTCNGEGICAPPEDCTVPCAEQGRCEAHVCYGSLYCCNPSDIAGCDPGLLCECISEVGCTVY